MPHVEMRDQIEAGLIAAAEAAATVVEEVGQTGGLQDREADRDVAGPLRDLALTDRTLVLPLLELRDHHAEDLHDDRGRDVRHDAEGEDGEVGQCAAREQLQEGEDAAGIGARLELLERSHVDARCGQMSAETVERDHQQGEQHLVAKVRDLEDVLQVGDHRWAPAVTETSRISGW